MPLSDQVKRLGRVRSKIRTDLWPDIPQIQGPILDKFVELRKFNEDMRLWSEQIRNMTELEGDPTADICD